MEEHEIHEPSTVPTASVLRAAKSQAVIASHADNDPILSLHKLKFSSLQSTIYNIGLSPFFVHYSTKHQNTVYRTLAKREPVCIAIDATGSILRRLHRPDKSKSGPLFLYAAVARSPSLSSVSSTCSFEIAQMISERHNTSAICNWLNEWISNTGVPSPKEIVCDSSKALLGACVKSFTPLLTMDDYADALANDSMPFCYIKIDVAHFIKNYVDFFVGARREIKSLYLAALGMLILAKNMNEARKIVYTILVVAMSESGGVCVNDPSQLSLCENQINNIQELATNPSFTLEDLQVESIQVTENRYDAPVTPNRWSKWASEIKETVESDIRRSPGKGVNAYWGPEFVKRFMVDIKWLPMWSCVVREKFGYGREPASSAHVEATFNNIKTHLLHGKSLPMRVDDFIPVHVQHLQGLMKEANAIIHNNNIVVARHDLSPSLDSPNSTHSINNVMQPLINTVPDKIIYDGVYKCVSPTKGDVSEKSGSDSLDLDNLDLDSRLSLLLSDTTARMEKFENDTTECIVCGLFSENLSLNTFDLNKILSNQVCAKCKQDLSQNNSLLQGELSFLSDAYNNQLQAQDPGINFNNVQGKDEMNLAPTECLACKNGDLPRGAHKCVVCTNPVHPFDECSSPYEGSNEGYGEKRICKTCKNQCNVPEILELRNVENWGGLADGSPKKKLKSGLYLNTMPENAFRTQIYLAEIPILKSGDSQELRAVRIGKALFDFSNTCAFDAIFHIFLVASIDSRHFRSFTIDAYSDTSMFFELMKNTVEKGIIASTYQLRGKLLHQLFFKNDSGTLNCFSIDCSTTTTALVRKLLDFAPCFIERTICSKKCIVRLTEYVILMVQKSDLIHTQYNERIEKELIPDASTCSTCRGKAGKKMELRGNMVLLEIVGEYDPRTNSMQDPLVMLKNILRALKFSFMTDQMHLRGVIHWQAPVYRNTRAQNLNDIGHYSPFSYRDNQWFNIHKKNEKVSNSFKVYPQLVLYTT